jgi:hypothetical protein
MIVTAIRMSPVITTTPSAKGAKSSDWLVTDESKGNLAKNHPGKQVEYKPYFYGTNRRSEQVYDENTKKVVTVTKDKEYSVAATPANKEAYVSRLTKAEKIKFEKQWEAVVGSEASTAPAGNTISISATMKANPGISRADVELYIKGKGYTPIE